VSGAVIETVVFDLGGVLIDWNPRHLYRKLSSDPAAIENFLTEVCPHSWNEEHDRGQPFAEGIAARVKLFPRHEAWIRAYFERWPEMLAGDIPGTVEVLREIHETGRHRLYALSNWSAETFPHATARFPFLQLFKTVLVSGQEKMMKPDPRFFGLLKERHGVDFSRAVFIDDVEKNIAAARALGFQAVRFTDPASLRRELRALGVLSR